MAWTSDGTRRAMTTLIRPLQERPAINQRGKVFVLVGRQTFSAAMVNAIDFRKQTNALLIGAPRSEGGTGGVAMVDAATGLDVAGGSSGGDAGDGGACH